MTCYLYWIHHKDANGDMKQGYIGISTNYKHRWGRHRRGETNPHLKAAIEKYGDDIVFELISSGTTEEMLRMETWLRPDKEIGWNIEKGGSLPPNLKGHKWSEETNQKRTASLKRAIAEGRFDRTSSIEATKARCKAKRRAIINTPQGDILEVEDFWDFAEEVGINRGSLRNVLTGKRSSVFGYTGHLI